ncbi:hypothetical protein BDZ97DRAFT_1925501 [Flammula alnicola]|nr:hypothetical protein BDZ97DRAFT_1925501 [Flammula alnicola]
MATSSTLVSGQGLPNSLDSEHVAFISNRLQLIIPPENAKPLQTRKPSRKSLSRRGRGALKVFLDLPLDVIFEARTHAVSYLEPLDLLTLARLSKEFRALFMSRSSLSVWRRVLNQVPGLPECPRDLTEPQYASLVFEKFCMACGSNHGVINVDYRRRLRMCVTCFKNNTISGHYLISEYGQFAQNIFPLLPCSGEDIDDNMDDSDKYYVYLDSTFFKPEAELMLAALDERTDEPCDTAQLSTFMENESLNALCMITEGISIALWHARKGLEAIIDAYDTIESRYQKIMAEIGLLGWDPAYFPEDSDEEFEEWEKYLRQPKEFSKRGWNMIRPKMEGIYLRCRRQRQIDSLFRRVTEVYFHRRVVQPDETRITMPGCADLVDDPFLEEFLDQKHAGCTDEEILAFVDDKLCNNPSGVFIQEVERGLLQQIRLLDVSEEPPFEGLEQARILFLCPCFACQDEHGKSGGLISYPEIIGHLADVYPDRRWSSLYPCIQRDVYIAAGVILETLGLEKNATKDEVNVLGKFVCVCHHHMFSGPLPFEQLVLHVYNEQQWYRDMKLHVAHNMRRVAFDYLLNSHSDHRLPELIRHTTSDDDAEMHPRTPLSIPETQSTDVPEDLICSYCYQLTFRDCPIRNETGEYHMRVKWTWDGKQT